MRVYKNFERKGKRRLSLCFQKIKTMHAYETEAITSLNWKKNEEPRHFAIFMSGLLEETGASCKFIFQKNLAW